MVHFAEINQAPPLYSILQYIGRVATSKLVPRNCLRYLETTLIVGGEGLVSKFTWGIVAFCETINVIRTKISHGIGEFSQKTQSCPFWLKIGTHKLLEVLISHFHLDFEIPTPKSIFGQIWVEKIKVVRFAWKLPHMVSWGYWFLFQY